MAVGSREDQIDVDVLPVLAVLIYILRFWDCTLVFVMSLHYKGLEVESTLRIEEYDYSIHLCASPGKHPCLKCCSSLGAAPRRMEF